MKLKDGDQIFVTTRDGAWKTGWITWRGPDESRSTSFLRGGYFIGPCGLKYSPEAVRAFGNRLRPHNYHHMGEQLVADGTL